jgi:hypothetical protein
MTPRIRNRLLVCLTAVAWAFVASPAARAQKDGSDTEGTPYKASEFTVINLLGVGDVKIVQTGKEAVRVKGDEEQLKGVKVEVNNKTLNLLGPGGAKPVEFIVEVKTLEGIILTGTGKMNGEKIDAKKLAIQVMGNGSISLSGKADSVQVSNLGVGVYQGEKLSAKQVAVNHVGQGLVVVNAQQQLDASILGTGSVEYVGSPKVRQNILGTGRVMKRR